MRHLPRQWVSEIPVVAGDGDMALGIYKSRVANERKRPKLGAIIAVSAVGILFLTATSASIAGAAGRRNPGPAPTISSFTTSYSEIGQYGGPAVISAQVANATECTISSSKPIGGLPVTVGCSSGSVSVGIVYPTIFNLPRDQNVKVKLDKLKLRVTGSKSAKARISVEVLPGWPITCSNLVPLQDLNYCNFYGQNLSNLNLSGSYFVDGELLDVNLAGTNLSGANLTGVSWGNTTCPDGTNSDNDGGTCVNNLTP